MFGTELEFAFRTIKLWEYKKRWAALEKDPNPFALVVMAHLKTKDTRGNALERLAWKIELVRNLYGRGYEREDVLELFRFIDWLLVLPETTARSFRQRIEELEQESKMRYVTSIERLGRQALRHLTTTAAERQIRSTAVKNRAFRAPRLPTPPSPGETTSVSG